ncbi:hypothetical protein [Singulisphaera acidiphila]|uniref:Uncharacterized protein n=1 Tax=Singulisphaera acidiphila (strain ATCC BAA-1392 / DSM 18658 / VKM B-2454 / MOB10) TaxID=886293 RepID=L0DC35_SINAD|nr:hypothetical protein [Singulisphaera acidiphila]AGA26415.1 hypothetical protein Sinac_2079 [Singulisphaera acidiphila DSM 18658]
MTDAESSLPRDHTARHVNGEAKSPWVWRTRGGSWKIRFAAQDNELGWHRAIGDVTPARKADIRPAVWSPGTH